MAGNDGLMGVCTENLNPDVVMVKSANIAGELMLPVNRARNRRVFVQ